MTSMREAELVRAAGQALGVSNTTHSAGASGVPPAPAAPLPLPPVGTMMSGMMMHGGLYTLTDHDMMSARLGEIMADAIRQSDDADAMRQHVRNMSAQGAAIPGFFFYHMVNKPYRLHSGLISYLSFPNRHLSSPVGVPPKAPGKTYSQTDDASGEIPAAFTFVGQFIDHDLTLNAMNLFDMQAGSAVMSEASPLLDLDNVYGPRLDDPVSAGKLRDVPMTNGSFQMRPIKDGAGQIVGYDACRADKTVRGVTSKNALIGDKRNDENQIILQIHLLMMRLHNAFMARYPDPDWHKSFARAKAQTILHWQAFVLHHYLPAIVSGDAISAVLGRLNNPATRDQLVQRPGRTICGGCTLGMPHEFAIGFRFGHSQLRSSYKLNPQHEFRLFDTRSKGLDDLQGGKCLTADRLINWPTFLGMTGANANFPSNTIDTKVTEVVFDLPESTIPDDLTLVSNLPFRNLVRSDSVGLCAGEDLAAQYASCYPANGIAPLQANEVEPDPNAHPLFAVEDNAPFRTPLWYYLLREAEVDRQKQPARGGRLGTLGSYLIAEVILSAIWYAPVSLFAGSPGHAQIDLLDGLNNVADVDLLKIAQYVQGKPAPPACTVDVC